MMEKKLQSMFEYQRFEPSVRLAEVIRKSTERLKRQLSDDELALVSAAGEKTAFPSPKIEQ